MYNIFLNLYISQQIRDHWNSNEDRKMEWWAYMLKPYKLGLIQILMLLKKDIQFTSAWILLELASVICLFIRNNTFQTVGISIIFAYTVVFTMFLLFRNKGDTFKEFITINNILD